ncbi:MAG: 4-alpha-glucanotransferase, partial [Chitinophagaceae bacterium]
TYNWQKMEETNFEWWQKRFLQMSYYFDAFRIDHILGFFRIWSIPLSAVEGIMGVFQPAMPVELQELSERGIWFDYHRYCKPFLTDDILYQLFGEQTEFVTETFLNKNSLGRYDFKEPFDTQRKVEDYFLQDGENENLKKGLFEALSNVVFFEQKDSGKRAYHFRISLEATSSFQQLDEGQKDKLKERYINYFYRRQDELWKKEGWRKLPFLKSSTDMLICGEDLGMVPDCVPEVMKRLGILSLEIQRMPKNAHTQFFHPAHAPYLSVITPSTHDMSTIRGWWEENRDTTQTFYNTVLEEQGQAPYYCDAWINRAIVLQHLYSPAMWSIFQLQDLLGMNDSLRRKNPQEERINQPADPKHYWKYRMHLYLEDLLQEKEFTNEIKDYINHSGRNL